MVELYFGLCSGREEEGIDIVHIFARKRFLETEMLRAVGMVSANRLPIM